jgi:two-component sensor histidine kinase
MSGRSDASKSASVDRGVLLVFGTGLKSRNVDPISPIEALHGELRGASPLLVGNPDLLRSVLSGCGDCIKVLDLHGRLIFMSEGGKRVMEVEGFSVLKGCPWPEFWAGEGNAHAVSAVASAAAGKTTRFQGAANTAKGSPRYWDVQVSPINGDDGKPTHLLSISRDITQEWNATELLKKNADRQEFLTAELQHRVKNMLATVMAIANRTFRGAAHDAPRLLFGTRLMALSQAHNLLTESNWDRAGIFGIVRGALETHQLDPGRVVVVGPDLDLDPKQALALALAINELATNAAKYGALSTPGGKVDVFWSRDEAVEVPAFVFEWRESGGPAVAAPTREGFGTRVIKASLADDFGGSVEIGYEPAGFVCTLIAPLENLPKARLPWQTVALSSG